MNSHAFIPQQQLLSKNAAPFFALSYSSFTQNKCSNSPELFSFLSTTFLIKFFSKPATSNFSVQTYRNNALSTIHMDSMINTESIRKRGGSYIMVEGSPKNHGRVCSGCGALIGDLSGLDESKVINVAAGSASDFDLRLRDRMFMKRDLTGGYLCKRCQLLSEGDFLSALQAIDDIDPLVFKNQLKHLKAIKCLIIKVVDALDFEGTFLRELRQLTGKNPIVLAVTKLDLLVRQDDHKARRRLLEWFRFRLKTKGMNVTEIFAVSGKTGEGILPLARYCFEKCKGRNMFVVGYANAGKSTLVNFFKDVCLKHMYMSGSNGYARKQKLLTKNVTISPVPGTSLRAVRIPCFKSHKHAIWDTPGVFVQRFCFEELKEQKRKVALLPPTVPEPVRVKLREGETIIIGDNNYIQVSICPYSDGKFHRSKYTPNPPLPVEIRWYSNMCREVHVVKTAKLVEGEPLFERFPRYDDASEDKRERRKVTLQKDFVPELSPFDRLPAADIVAFNLGFMSIKAQEKRRFTVQLYAPSALQPIVRPIMPIPDYALEADFEMDEEEYDNVQEEILGKSKEIDDYDYRLGIDSADIDLRNLYKRGWRDHVMQINDTDQRKVKEHLSPAQEALKKHEQTREKLRAVAPSQEDYDMF